MPVVLTCLWLHEPTCCCYSSAKPPRMQLDVCFLCTLVLKVNLKHTSSLPSSAWQSCDSLSPCLQAMSTMAASSSQHPTCRTTGMALSFSPKKEDWKRSTSRMCSSGQLQQHMHQAFHCQPSTLMMPRCWTLRCP